MEIKIIYQDKNLLILDKPAGILVHKTGKSAEATIADWLLKNFPEVQNVGDDPQTRPGIVHRLDRDTSGVLTVARNSETFDYLKKSFQQRKIKKTYLALVWGSVKEKSGIINKPIGIKQGGLKRTTRIEGAKMVKEAVTAYKILKLLKHGDQEFTLLEVEPKTGRTHQIRVHLASMGYPIVGDRLYSKRPLPEKLTRIFLHADSLELTLPNGSRLKVSADLPQDLEKFIATLISNSE